MNDKILIITDTHIGENSINTENNKICTYGGDINILLPIKKYMQNHSIRTVIHLGDGSIRKLEEKSQINLQIRSMLQCDNYYQLPGNHDIPYITKGEYDLLGFSVLPKVISVGKYDIFMLDIKLNNKLGYISKSTISFLEKGLQKSIKEKIVFCHYPCSEVQENISYYHEHNPERSFLTNSKDIRVILNKYGVNMYISGHTHFYFEQNIESVTHTTIPSFTENNGYDRANLQFAILDCQTNTANIEIITL